MEQQSTCLTKARESLQLELVGETVEVDGEQKPRQLSRTFSVAASKKSSLRGFISGWNGVQYSDDQFADLDLFDRAGKVCQLNVVLNDTGEYANVDSVIPLPKGMPAPKTDTPLILWNMDNWTNEGFEVLPEWVQEKIKKSTQYQKDHTPGDSVDFKEPSQTAAPAVQQKEALSGGGCPI